LTRFTFSIPAITPSLNKLVKGRTHWTEYRRLKSDWFYLVKIGCQYLDIPAALPYEKREANFVSYRLALLDPDNLAGGAKILWDSMVNAGLLFDDSEKFLITGKPRQVQVKKRKDERTEVVLTIF
jgi:hypothetical protein